MNKKLGPVCIPTARIEEARRGLVLKIWGCRTMFANVNKPRAPKDGKAGGYDCEYLLPKTAEGAAEAVKAIREFGAKTFGKTAWKAAILRDGDREIQDRIDNGLEVDDLFRVRAGHYIIRANAKLDYPPQVAGNIYSGCYAGAVIGVAAFEAPDKSSRGVKGYLNGCQFQGDGEAFGGSTMSIEDMMGIPTPLSQVLPEMPAGDDFTAGLPGYDDRTTAGRRPANTAGDIDELPF